MELSRYSHSESFYQSFDQLVHPEMASFGSFKGRATLFLQFLETIGIIPLAFVLKSFRTLCRLFGVVFGAALLILTLCGSGSIRALFVRRVTSLAQDLADWVIWPVAALGCLGRLFCAALIHPALYFGF